MSSVRTEDDTVTKWMSAGASQLSGAGPGTPGYHIPGNRVNLRLQLILYWWLLHSNRRRQGDKPFLSSGIRSHTTAITWQRGWFQNRPGMTDAKVDTATVVGVRCGVNGTRVIYIVCKAKRRWTHRIPVHIQIRHQTGKDN